MQAAPIKMRNLIFDYLRAVKEIKKEPGDAFKKFASIWMQIAANISRFCLQRLKLILA